MRTRKTPSLLCVLVLLASCAAGCAQNEGLKNAKEMLASMQVVSDLLKTVQDPASASAAAPQVAPAFQRMLDAMDAMIAYEQKHGQVRARQKTIDQLEKDLSRIRVEFTAETQRVNALKNLPEEFWTPMRFYSYKTLLAGLKATGAADSSAIELINRMIAIYDAFGPERTVEIGVTNVFQENRAETIEKFRAMCGSNSQIVEFEDPDRGNALVMVMGPVEDFDALIAKIDFGKVVEREKARRELEVELALPKNVMAAGDFGRSGGFGVPRRGNFDPEKMHEEMRQHMEESQARIEESFARTREEAMKSIEDMEASELVPKGSMSFGVGNDELDESAPDYHARLAEMLASASLLDRRQAMQKLRHIKPQSVTDSKVRAKIARGYRELAFESPHVEPAIIKGLVIWGGKHSVPLLIELMEQQSRIKVDAAIYDGLAEHPTPEGAEAVAARVGNFFDGQQAAACLKKMGPAAEEAVIEIAPSNDLQVNLFALDFLKDHGTEKSYDILQRARKSPHPMINQAAIEALREIRLREQKRKKEEKPAA